MLTSKDIDNLLARHFSGEQKNGDDQLLTQWLNNSEENETYFLELTRLYQDLAGTEKLQFNTDTAFQNFKAYIDKDELHIPKQQSKKTRRIFLPYLIAVVSVAAILLFILLPSTDKYDVLNENIVYSLANNAQIQVYEGEVLINKNNKNDTIYMNGKVEFSLNSAKNGSSIIKVENLFVKDVGTTFWVDASNTDSIVVAVQNGIVQFYNQREGIELYKGDKGYYIEMSKKFHRIAYTGSFVFENKTLTQIVNELQIYYGRDILIRDKDAEQLSVWVSFDNEDLTTILDIISTTLGLKAEYNNHQYILL